MSRNSFSSRLAGKTSPTTSKTWSVPSSLRISRSRSSSFCKHAAFAGVLGDEVEDEAVVLLAVAVDAAHALLQPDGVPGDVVVDHQPAELEVDAFAGGLGGDQHLGGFLAELPLGVDARARRVAVADLHAAVDLRDGQAPLAQLAERAAVLAVAGEVVERVLVLGEDEQLHLRVAEDSPARSARSCSLVELRLDVPRSPSLRAWSISLASCAISSRRAAGSTESDLAFELADDLAAARLRAVRRSRRGRAARSAACR